jgi:hypothetical protein
MKNFEQREYNYSFEIGDRVKIADDIPTESKHGITKDFNWMQKVDLESLVDKVGVVVECNSDLKGPLGNAYIVKVAFDELLVNARAVYFLPLSSFEIKKMTAKKRLKNI